MQLFGKSGKLEAKSLVAFWDKYFSKIFLWRKFVRDWVRFSRPIHERKSGLTE
jgi:hypothetical protein